MPGALPLYDAFTGSPAAMPDNVSASIRRTQVSFSCKNNFALVSNPAHWLKGRPRAYIIVSFGPGRPPGDLGIAARGETYPDHRIYHVIVQSMGGIDGQLMG